MIRTLTDLIGEAQTDRFLDHFVAKTRWHAVSGDAQRAQALLPWPQINRLIAQDAIPADSMRVVLNRNTAERHMYRDAESNRIRSDALQGMIAQGATFLINHLGHLVPAIDELAVNIERSLRCRTHVNGYFSFGVHSAFRTHADNHDVVILQVHGARRWRCYGQYERFPLRGRHTPELTQVQWEGVLNPGDVLYVPRGDVHAAVPEMAPSVHLTIGVTENTGVDFIRWLADKAAADERFRFSLPGLPADRDPGERARREAAFRSALLDLIDRSSIDEMRASEDRKRQPRVVANLDFANRLAPESLLVSALSRRLDLEVDDTDTFKIEIAGQGVRLSQMERNALQMLTAHPRLSFADLAASLGTVCSDVALVEALTELAHKALIAIAEIP